MQLARQALMPGSPPLERHTVGRPSLATSKDPPEQILPCHEPVIRLPDSLRSFSRSRRTADADRAAIAAKADVVRAAGALDGRCRGRRRGRGGGAALNRVWSDGRRGLARRGRDLAGADRGRRGRRDRLVVAHAEAAGLSLDGREETQARVRPTPPIRETRRPFAALDRDGSCASSASPLGVRTSLRTDLRRDEEEREPTREQLLAHGHGDASDVSLSRERL